MNNTKNNIILLSNELNNICQALGLLPPKRLELSYGAQLIPTILIGRVQFFGRNWLCSKDDKLIRLMQYVIDSLRSAEFLEINIQELKGTPLTFDGVFCNDSDQPFIRPFFRDFP